MPLIASLSTRKSKSQKYSCRHLSNLKYFRKIVPTLQTCNLVMWLRWPSRTPVPSLIGIALTPSTIVVMATWCSSSEACSLQATPIWGTFASRREDAAVKSSSQSSRLSPRRIVMASLPDRDLLRVMPILRSSLIGKREQQCTITEGVKEALGRQ